MVHIVIRGDRTNDQRMESLATDQQEYQQVMDQEVGRLHEEVGRLSMLVINCLAFATVIRGRRACSVR